MSYSRSNSAGSVDTVKYSHSPSNTDNYSNNFELEPEMKQTPAFRKAKNKPSQWKKKPATNMKPLRMPLTYGVNQKILAAKRLNNSELMNQNADLLRQVEEQKDEIRILKRMEFRQSKALEKFENRKNRLPMLLESYNREMNCLKEQVRMVNARHRKSTETLREVEDELEKTKNRLNKYKVLVDDENLQGRADLTKQLNVAQQKIKDLETRNQNLDAHIHHLAKNHKYEVNMEKSQNKKLKLRNQELEEKYNRLEIQLLEKEKELEVWNIYSNRQKTTTQNTPHSTPPSLRSKLVERVSPLTPPPLRMKRYEERRRQATKNKESTLKRTNQSAPTTADSTKTAQPSANNHSDLNLPKKASNQQEKTTEAMAVPKVADQKITQEDGDGLGEKLENLKLDQIELKTLAEPLTEPEKTATKEIEEKIDEEKEWYKSEELRKSEIEKIEANARKEREQLEIEQRNERKKKELLLAKLKELDNEPQVLLSSPRSNLFADTPTKTGYSFTKEIENLHQGKPSSDLHFFDSSFKPSYGKPNSVAKSKQINAAAPTHNKSRSSLRKSDNMIEDFFFSPNSPHDADKLPSFVSGDTPIDHGPFENRAKLKKHDRTESHLYKGLIEGNTEEKDLKETSRHQPSRHDSVWLNDSANNNVGGLFSGDGLTNGYNDSNKLLPSRSQVNIFETRSNLNTFDNSCDSIEEIVL